MTDIISTRADLVTEFGAGVTPPTLVRVSGWYNPGDGFDGVFEYQPSLASFTDPEGAPIVVDAQSRPWKCVELEYQSKISLAGCVSAIGRGDSMMVGQASSPYSTMGYFQRFCAKWGLTPVNNAVSGKGTFLATNLSFSNDSAVAAAKRGNLLVLGVGHNDAVYGNTLTPAKVYNELVAAISNWLCATSVPANSSSVTHSAGSGWFAGSGINEKATKIGGYILATGGPGDMLTGTFTGDNFCLRSFTNDGTSGNCLRTIDLWIDDPGTYLPANRVLASYDGDLGYDMNPIDGALPNGHYGHAANLFFALGAVSHTFAIAAGEASALGGTTCYIDTFDTMRSPILADPILVFIPPRPSSYTVGPGTSTPASFSAVDVAIIQAVELFRNAGYQIAIARSNDFLDPANLASDDEHPLNPGHGQLERAGSAQVEA